MFGTKLVSVNKLLWFVLCSLGSKQKQTRRSSHGQQLILGIQRRNEVQNRSIQPEFFFFFQSLLCQQPTANSRQLTYIAAEFSQMHTSSHYCLSRIDAEFKQIHTAGHIYITKRKVLATTKSSESIF